MGLMLISILLILPTRYPSGWHCVWLHSTTVPSFVPCMRAEFPPETNKSWVPPTFCNLATMNAFSILHKRQTPFICSFVAVTVCVVIKERSDMYRVAI